MENSSAKGDDQHINGHAPEQPSAAQEPGVTAALSQIQHIIKDSTTGQQSSPQPRSQGSGYTSPRDPASPPSEPASSRQQAYPTGLQEPPATSLEDDMSEISISEPLTQTSNLSNARGSGLKPKLSGPRKSSQPPTSPFAMDEEPFKDDAPAANTPMATFDVEVSSWCKCFCPRPHTRQEAQPS